MFRSSITDGHVAGPAAAAWRVTRWLLAAVGFLFIMHVVRLNTPRDLSFEALRMVIDEFHFDREANVPTWFSSTMMTAAAALMIWIGVRARREHQRFARRWIAMGVIFLLLSMDETASFHEMLIDPLRARFDLRHRAFGMLHFAWVVPALALLAALGLAYLSFLVALPAKTRWGLVAAGALYVSGAVGMEMVGGALAARRLNDSTMFAVSISIEETCEMLGLVLLLHTLVAHAVVRQNETAVAPAELHGGVPPSSRARSLKATRTD